MSDSLACSICRSNRSLPHRVCGDRGYRRCVDCGAVFAIPDSYVDKVEEEPMTFEAIVDTLPVLREGQRWIKYNSSVNSTTWVLAGAYPSDPIFLSVHNGSGVVTQWTLEKTVHMIRCTWGPFSLPNTNFIKFLEVLEHIRYVQID